MAKVLVEGLSYSFKSSNSKVKTLEKVSFECQQGEIITVVGPSGCGKSTLLSLIAGLKKPTDGRISIDGKVLERPYDGLGVIFQKNTLLPWRTAKENVELGLELRGVKPAEREKIALDLLSKYGLAGFENRYPHALSGGMQKRVAILQTLAYEPELLLVDEAFSALDAQTRTLIQDEFLKICKEMGKTVIMVTHDITEAICMSDRVIVLSARPASVKSEHYIHFADVKDSIMDTRTLPEFVSYYKSIWDELEISRGLL